MQNRIFRKDFLLIFKGISLETRVATRLEWSSFCETQWSKKAGVLRQAQDKLRRKCSTKIIMEFLLVFLGRNEENIHQTFW